MYVEMSEGYEMTFDVKKDGKRILVICIAALMMATNIKTFVRTGGLYPGGATGLTILVQEVGKIFFRVELPYTLINLLINAGPVYIGFRFIGKKFTLYSCLMIVLTSVLTDIIPGYIITYDILLISIFGGIINGTVISLCLMMNATTGGTDFISIYMSEKKGMDSWNLIFGINFVILSAAGVLFGWDKALYSIIFQFASTQVLHMMYKRYQKETLFIVTNKATEVCSKINELSGHGATVMSGEGFYEGRERSVVYSVVSKEESGKVIRGIREVDEKAFVNAVKTEELMGRFVYKRTE